VESLLEVHLTARRERRRRGAGVRFRPGLLLWALLLLLAVPTLALAETEAPPAPPSTDTPALLDDGSASAPVESYGTLPNGEEEITFEPSQSGSAPAGTVEAPPVTAPSDPGASPAPADQTPADPAAGDPTTTPPTDPAGEQPTGETPVDEPPVGSVIDQSPEQEPSTAPPYTPPVTAFPPADIPVPAADPLPTTVIPTDIASYVQTPAPPAVQAPVPPPASTPAAPIVRPPMPVTRAVTIPGVPIPPHPSLAPKPESSFTTGADLVAATAMPPAATPTKRPEDGGAMVPGLSAEDLSDVLTPRVTSPLGPTPGGSQLFQVLAQYVMSGGSGPPTGVALLLLVQIATVLGAFAWRTPRSMFQMVLGVSDKLFVGYRAVALRPG
jgi:hypothetical protein